MKPVVRICLTCLEERKRTLSAKDSDYVEYCTFAIAHGNCYLTLDDYPDERCKYTAELAVEQT